MKKLLLILAPILFAASCFAQNECNQIGSPMPYTNTVDSNGVYHQTMCADSSGKLNIALGVLRGGIVFSPNANYSGFGNGMNFGTNTAACPFGNSNSACYMVATNVGISNLHTTGTLSFVTNGQEQAIIDVNGNFKWNISKGQHFFNQAAQSDAAGVATCVTSTVTVTFTTAYTSTPVIMLSDETTTGGARVSAKSNSAFTITCTGATDVVDYTTSGNPT